MADDHLHDPLHEHEHDHGHGPPGPVRGGAAPDAAAASLTAALRMTFRLLTVVMVVVLALFAMTGVTCVPTGQKGVVTVFGRRVRDVGPGLQYTWPFPVGHIETVSSGVQTLKIREFWMLDGPDDAGKTLLERSGSESLRPGLDGALLTGDSYLVHTKIEVQYTVRDPAEYLSGTADPNAAIRSAVCRAAVHAAALRTAAGLMLGDEQGFFKADVKSHAQEYLDRLKAGVEVVQINLEDPTWPLRARREYEAAQNAAQQSDKQRNDAIGAANKFLGDVAGPNYLQLVGVPWEAGDPNAPARPDYDLIGQYERVREANDIVRAEALLARIDTVLLSQSTQGAVAAAISQARSARDDLKQAAAARADYFQKVLPEYLKAPQFLLEREWIQAREEILNSPTLVKWILSPGDAKTILLINTPPKIARDIAAWYLQAPAAATPPRRPPSSPPPGSQGPGGP